MKIEYSDKIKALPPYLFAEIDKLKNNLKSQGKEIISLGIGDPDMPTPSLIVESLKKYSELNENHHYPSYEGLFQLRKKISEWFYERYKVKLNPDNEILSLIGSKEGIAHLPFAFVNKGDYVLVPDPSYPVYRSATIFAGGIPYFMPLLESNNFLPDLNSIPKKILNKAKIMFLNYPNNPTSAVAPEEFLKNVIEFASKYNIIIAYDAAYNELYFEKPPLSILQLEGGKEVAIEFHSFSKTYNMTGWRIGFAVGNPEIIKGLGEIKNNVDSGIFQPIQYAAISALENYQTISSENRKIYRNRRDFLLKELDTLGWQYFYPEATFYVWIKCLKGYKSKEMASKLLEEEGIVVTPGIGFGNYGENYIRIALTVNEEIIKKVFNKIMRIKW